MEFFYADNCQGFAVVLVFEMLIAELMFRNRNGFSIVELMIVVAIIGLLSAILVPAVMKSRASAQQKSCISNLRQIDQAIQQWAAESKAQPTDVVTHSNVVPYLRNLPVCPSSATNRGTFFMDYGMTFIKEYPYCFENNELEGNPHVFNAAALRVVTDPAP